MLHTQIQALIERALRAAQAAGDLPDVTLPEISVERPSRPEHGDFATPVAMPLAGPMKRTPREIAETIVEYLPSSDLIAGVEVAGPGFINFRLSPDWLATQVDRILAKGPRYADPALGQGRRVQVEFVSANPTGPLTVGHGRNAVIGDTLANILEAAGWDVTREYYYNDGGLQMKVLGESVKLRLRKLLGEPVEFPEEYYQGEYLVEIAQKILDEYGEDVVERDWEFFKAYAEEEIFAEIRATLECLNIVFDVFTNEVDFYENGAVWNVVDRLRERGYAYDRDGAVWFKATAFGSDKDRVLIRSTGEPTYRLPDIAYHIDKLERGFDLVINVLGADHVAQAPDVKNALRALGYDDSRIQAIFHQFVTLVRAGEAVKMSTRRATFVTLDELIDEVGADAVRFFMIQRSPDAQMTFDLELATEQSDENPVYYVQYAHARTAGILERNAPAYGVTYDSEADVGLLTHPAETALINEMLRLGEVLQLCAERLEPHQLAFYARDLAGAFSAFYRDCPVLTAEDDGLIAARMKLVRAAQTALARVLDLMGMTAPKEM